MRIRPWQLSLLALGLCALALFATLNYRASRLVGHDWIFRRLPTDHAVIAGIDVAALRRADLVDLLSTPRALTELGYRQLTDQGHDTIIIEMPTEGGFRFPDVHDLCHDQIALLAEEVALGLR